MKSDLRPQHRRLLEALKLELDGNSQPLRVKKRTISNLFRYEGRLEGSSRLVDLSRFNQPLYLDSKAQTLDVQGLATYEQIVDFVLPQGFLPTVVPELKHITIGGATVGIGIETNSYRYGFVHDGLLEADVLLPDGTIVTVAADNQYSDLFYGLPNSYGTLGYIIRAKIRLLPAKPFVSLATTEFNHTNSFLAAMKAAAGDPTIDYIEGLAYSGTRLYLTSASQTKLSPKTSSIYGQNIFYRRISHAGEMVLPTKDYLFRYDPEWFWNIPESRFFNLFRQIAPTSIRNSGFYARYNRWQQKTFGKPNTAAKTHEALIQDWEVPWTMPKPYLNLH